MFLIPCPHCGARAQTEFTYGGDASVERPVPAPALNSGEEAGIEPAVLQQWLDHIYLRDNPRGEHLEWWQHSSGCRAWIKVRRDTATHEILGAWRATDGPALRSASVPGKDGVGR